MGSGARLVSVDEGCPLESDHLREREAACFFTDHGGAYGVVVPQVHLRGVPYERRGLLVREPVAADQEVVEVGPQVLEQDPLDPGRLEQFRECLLEVVDSFRNQKTRVPANPDRPVKDELGVVELFICNPTLLISKKDVPLGLQGPRKHAPLKDLEGFFEEVDVPGLAPLGLPAEPFCSGAFRLDPDPPDPFIKIEVTPLGMKDLGPSRPCEHRKLHDVLDGDGVPAFFRQPCREDSSDLFVCGEVVPDQGPLPRDGDTSEGVLPLDLSRGLDEVVVDLGHQGDIRLDGCLPEAFVLKRVHPPLGLGGADLIQETQALAREVGEVLLELHLLCLLGPRSSFIPRHLEIKFDALYNLEPLLSLRLEPLQRHLLKV